MIDLEFEKAKRLFKKHGHPLSDNLVEIGIVKEIDGVLCFKGCTFDMKGGDVDIADLNGNVEAINADT
jgi:hypothetical protein